MIVALLNQKGGVGKTTLATHIAGELALRGQNVILLDADPQGSALDWTGPSDATSRACPSCSAPSAWRARRCTRKPRSWLIVPIT